MGRKEVNDFFNSMGIYGNRPVGALLLSSSEKAENVLILFINFLISDILRLLVVVDYP
jgi:hypothetical protein